jgi:hypothetical protein
MKIGGSKWRVKHTVPVALTMLDQDFFGTSMTDPKSYEEIYERNLLVELIERRIEKDHRKEIRETFKMLREGYAWDEIAARLKSPNPETLKKRFWRWIRSNFP